MAGNDDRGGFVLPFWWDIQKLHGLHPPVRALPIDELRWQLHWRVWSNYGAPFHVSPSEVRRDPKKFAIHYQRAMDADLEYPIYVVAWAGRWTILDGMHRLLKADILGQKDIACYVLEPAQVADIMVPPPDEAMELLRHFFEENPEREESGDDAGPVARPG